MKIRYLLDTNVLSEPLKPNPNPQVISQLFTCIDYAATAAPVVYEMVHGAKRLPPNKKQAEILRYLEEVVYPKMIIFPYDREAALLHGELQATLSLRGQVVPVIDGQIAAIALLHQLTLVTRNVADFRHFSALRTENWFA